MLISGQKGSSTTMSLSIIFIHTGYSDYMEYSLRQAKYTNPDSEIILLGDESNDRFDFVTHVNIKDYFTSASEFAKIYKHCSTNPYKYELFCFQRWFALYEFITKKQIDEVFVCDSDVLVYADISRILKGNYKNIEFGCLWHYPNKAHNAAISFWSKKSLSAFCKNINTLYTESSCLKKIEAKWKKVKESGIPGSFSDMDSVEDFTNKYSDKMNIINFCETINNSVFDNNVNEPSCFHPNEYKYSFGVKKIIWKEKIPYCFNIKEKKNIKFNCLHMQGSAKYLISRFYTGKNFKEKSRLDIKFFFANIAAFWYKTLKIRYRFAFIFNRLHKKIK